MDELKELLGEDLFKQVTEKIGTKKLLLQEKDGDFIPRKKLNEEIEKVKELNESLTKAQAELETLKKGDPNSKLLEDKIKELNDKLEKRDKEAAENTKRETIKSHFRELKANDKYVDDLTDKFLKKHGDNLEFENGKVKDAENLFKPFQEDYKEMFGKFVVKGIKHEEGNPPEGLYSQAQLDLLSKQDVKDNYKKVQDSLAYLSKTGV